MKLLAASLSAFVLSFGCPAFADDSILLSPEFRHVTYQSSLKLCNSPSHYYLYSDAIAYGSGSKEQFVSGIGNADEANALFLIMEASQERYQQRGTMVQCGDKIRLQHVQTKKFLSSDSAHLSPLSRQQEVACIKDGRHTTFTASSSTFGSQSHTADWQVVCPVESTSKGKKGSDDKAKFLERDRPFRLKHVQSGLYLTLMLDKTYTQPIQGQVEVVAQSRDSLKGTLWMASEGVYFAAAQPLQNDL